MSTASGTATQTQPLSSGHHGRRHRGHAEGRQALANAVPGPAQPVTDNGVPPTESEDGTVCWICAEPVKFYSVSECNHRTCHVCALRLKALYKRMDCTFCKYPQTALIFTQSPDDVFDSYTPERIPFKDNRLSIFFESQDMMEETLILLRFNCPESSCDFTAHGWGDLKMHVRAAHGRLMCDMCIRHKKIFAHEHLLYQPSQLPLHLPSIPHRPPKSQVSDKVEGGVHPMCQFCCECHFGDDELFAHMRERHEECFLCKRNGIRDQYFKDYNSLEHHFNAAHYPCNDPQCLIQKFVVFGSLLDLKAHVVEQHGGEMTARDRKDARRIDTAFEHNDAGEPGGNNRRQGRNRAGERERQTSELGPPRSRRRDAFRSVLTSESTAQSISTPQRSPEEDQNLPPADVDPVTVERHTAFIARINVLASNSASAVPAIKAAVRSYKSSESRPRDLISTVFNVVNRELDGAASLISSLVELLDDEDKRRELLSAWNGFKIEQQRQFPDLVPTAVGSEYAGVVGGVLNVKHSAIVRPYSTQSPRQVWDRVAQAAASSSSSRPSPSPALRSQERFPALAAKRAIPAFRQSPHTTAWSAAGSSAPPSSSRETSGMHPTITNSRNAAPTPRATPPRMSPALFPTLPSSASNNQQQPTISGSLSLKHIRGKADAPSANVWGSKLEDPKAAPTPPIARNDDDPPASGTGKGKKKKGKEKQTLFTFGTFPT